MSGTIVEADNLRYTKMPLNNGSGAIPACSALAH